ncbi:hypothetical protein DH2020_016428 [Rehmannia glutinosa]|uniref:Glycosyl transferase family 1 domain-containing protein n=1 Tax=Rehmannia glutinosa TaxID=99300 RepID=A0ABR0WMZ1_REHGL
MENRREYFNRSKLVLNRVKKLIFLSESQSKQWLTWCEEENIQLNSEPALVPLSVNDELAFVAGISSSLNTPSFTTEKMLEKRQLLRSAVRKEMGLSEDDMLAATLSSINPGKGQLLILESARLMIEQGTLMNNTSAKDSILIDQDYYYSRALLQNTGKKEENLKILIGSVGSKSNKVMYVKTLLRYLSTHSNLSKSVLWTPATTRVASLYAAADVYIMNSQGLGETFGRVTIEAMAFGLPIYTDFDIVRWWCRFLELILEAQKRLRTQCNRTSPSFRSSGARVLARNLDYLLQNPSARQEMGIRGREKVQKMYLKKQMFQKFGEVLYKCMRIK